jgi:hypothetical protein
MVNAVADELIAVVEKASAEMRAFDAARSGERPAADAWSPREVLGHLIDSAANNHQRFVRAQEAPRFAGPGYDQDHWVRVQDYRNAGWSELVELWRLYNRHLAHVIRNIPSAALSVECVIGSNDPVTLAFLVEDYVVHMKHHLDQIRASLA